MRNLYLFNKVLALLLLLGSFEGWGQKTTTVTGRVISDDDGTGLPGVSILEKGTSNGTVTDAEGDYSLSVSENATLVFSFVGYASQEQQVNGRTAINVTLLTDVTALDEVVVIGYGTQEKKDMTGSVTSISTKDFNRGVVTSPQELLVGKVAGVQITTASGAPGAGAAIRIRGQGSILANSEPLIVIDGFPIDNNNVGGSSNALATLNPNDIESVNVLKDASGTAIYGSRASNGVIIITTKKGKTDRFQLNYSGNYSLSAPQKYFDVMTGDEYRAAVTDAVESGRIASTAVDLLGSSNTDWQKEIYRNAFTHDHNLNASGQAGLMGYRVSYGYTDQDGILKNTGLTRNSVNINLTPSLLGGALNINAGFKGSLTKHNFGNDGAIGAAVSFDPTKPARSGEAQFAPYDGFYAWLQPNGRPISIAGANPVALIEQTDNRSDVLRGIGTLQIDYAIPFVEGLKANLSTGFDISDGDGYNNVVPTAAWSSGGPGQKITYHSERMSKLFDFFFNYKKNLNEHAFDLTAGYSYQDFDRDGWEIRSNAAGRKFTYYELQDGDTVALQYTPHPNTLISVFGRLNYSLKDRYLLTATIRNDASSRFSPETRSGWFPSVAVGWRLSDEAFLANTKVSNLKLRGSYGITGQQDITDNAYPYLPLITRSTPTANYQFGDAFYTTYRPEEFDAAIKWEETTTYNAGLDFGFAGDRFSGTLDVYKRISEDLINRINVAAGSNLNNELVTNVGSLENRGVELTLSYAIMRKENFNWNLGVNFTHNKNEITRLIRATDDDYEGLLVGDISGGVGNTIQVHRVGHPAFAFYVNEQVYDESGMPIENLYVDHTAEYETNRVIMHSPNPEFLAGINSSLNYKKFDFSFSGRLSINNYVYNNMLSERARYDNIFNPAEFLNNVPSALYETNFDNARFLSSHYLENASFFKMDFISAGYSFDHILNDKLKGRIGFTVNNAFFITEYSGLDPEVSGGIDRNIYPRARTFMLNLNITY